MLPACRTQGEAFSIRTIISRWLRERTGNGLYIRLACGDEGESDFLASECRQACGKTEHGVVDVPLLGRRVEGKSELVSVSSPLHEPPAGE